MSDNREKGFDKDRTKAYEFYLESIEEELLRCKEDQQKLKSRLARLIIKQKRDIPEGTQKEKLNENRNILESEINIVDLMIETYEIKSKVLKLDNDIIDLAVKNREGEYVSDLLKSNRFEVEVLNKQAKENSDRIKEFQKELSEKIKKYQDQFGMLDKEQGIKIMEKAISLTPEGQKKDKMIEVKKDLQANTNFVKIIDKTKKNLEEIVKNDKEYEILLERKKEGESVKDLIKQNRNYDKILKKKDKRNIKEAKRWQRSLEGMEWFMNATQRRKQALTQMKQLYDKHSKVINEIKKNETEIIALMERKKMGENIEDLITQNRDYAEILDIKWLKLKKEAKKFLIMNRRVLPDFFQNPKNLQSFLDSFGFSPPSKPDKGNGSTSEEGQSRFPPISELIQKKSQTKDKPSKPDKGNKSTSEDS